MKDSDVPEMTRRKLVDRISHDSTPSSVSHSFFFIFLHLLSLSSFLHPFSAFPSTFSFPVFSLTHLSFLPYPSSIFILFLPNPLPSIPFLFFLFFPPDSVLSSSLPTPFLPLLLQSLSLSVTPVFYPLPLLPLAPLPTTLTPLLSVSLHKLASLSLLLPLSPFSHPLVRLVQSPWVVLVMNGRSGQGR